MITDYILEKMKWNLKIEPVPTGDSYLIYLEMSVGFYCYVCGQVSCSSPSKNDHPEDYAAQLRAHLLPNMDTAVPPKSVRTVDYSKAGTEVRHMAFEKS